MNKIYKYVMMGIVAISMSSCGNDWLDLDPSTSVPTKVTSKSEVDATLNGIYSTMLNLLQNNLEQGLSLGLNTIFNSGAIAIGVILVSSIAKILKRKNTKKPMTLPRI